MMTNGYGMREEKMQAKNWNLRTNMSMLTDFYEFTMSNGYLKQGMEDTLACFDLFFRNVPDSGGYAIMAGVEQMIDYLLDLNFTAKDLAYLASLEIFCQEFLD